MGKIFTEFKQRVPTEAQEQMWLMQWIGLHPILKGNVISIPNEGLRSPRNGAKLKRMGLTPGAADLFVAVPTKLYHGLFLELKRISGSTVSVAQLEFGSRMRKMGYQAKICYGWEEAKETIEYYLANTSLTGIMSIP